MFTIGEFMEVNIGQFSYVYVYWNDGKWNKYHALDIIPKEIYDLKVEYFSVHCENNMPQYYFYV